MPILSRRKTTLSPRLVVSIAMLLLKTTTTTIVFSSAFSPPTRHAAMSIARLSTTAPGFERSRHRSIDGHGEDDSTPFGANRIVAVSTKAATPRTKATRLYALPSPSVWWAVGHVVGGSSAAPIVAKATKSGGWYRNKLDLPPWTPPDKIFAPVWTLLYSMMGVAASRVYSKVGGSLKSPLLILWFIHYALNLIWAPIFFGLKCFKLGQAINFLLLSTLAIIIPSFYKMDQLSGFLLVPYLAWCIFATCLNGAICKRNPAGIKDV